MKEIKLDNLLSALVLAGSSSLELYQAAQESKGSSRHRLDEECYRASLRSTKNIKQEIRNLFNSK